MELTGVQIALEQLELSGVVLRGRFTSAASDELEWCERRLLARIHRLTLEGLRRQVAPVDAEGFMRFLLAHHEISADSLPRGVGGLQRVLSQLEGFEAAGGIVGARSAAGADGVRKPMVGSDLCEAEKSCGAGSSRRGCRTTVAAKC